MSIVIEGGRIPPRWLLEGNSRPGALVGSERADRLNIAFINNMPDAALEDTELQFFTLLDIASGDVPVSLKLYSLPGIPRGERGQRHIDSFYYGVEDLWQTQFDGVIITGTEPQQPNLRDEPYWKVLGVVFDWAERNTTSAVLSCLAAHASVLHGDGVRRHRLPDKQFGVFDATKACDHALLSDSAQQIRFPHSRWNELKEDELTAAGYVVLTKSAEAGVDTFVKQRRNSLFLHFQGHPEYGSQTLFKEYRRDIKRFLNRERDTYPTMPSGYFDAAATQLLDDFQKQAMADPREQIMTSFPEDGILGSLQNGWHTSAVSIYKNWLRYLQASETRGPELATMTSAFARDPEKSSASR
jgi:homoserine O-succinyltransferase/O-acetyltransferase